MTREYRLFIQDILQAIKDIAAFVEDMGFKEFSTDQKTKSAVVWQIHVIGEATKNIPKSIRDKYKEVPWKYMARIRDKIAHFYFGIDYEIVWEVITKKLPAIKSKMAEILEDIKNDQ